MGKLTINVEELGKVLGISRAKAYELANSKGFYPAIKLGRRLLISITALNKWIDAQTQP